VAIAVLILFGVALLIPRLAERLERPLAAFSRLGPRTRGDGLASGLFVGAALGFVYAPCAGPILATVISVSAASGRAVAVGLAYAAGTGLMLLVLALSGRRILDYLRRSGRTIAVQRVLGVVMVATAIALATMLDVKLDQWIALHIPNVNISAFVDNSSAVSKRLATVRTHKQRFSPAAQSASLPGISAPNLQPLGEAPAFTGTEDWFNTPGDRPLTIAGLHGHVVLIDFWTYTCINCIRTLPYLEAWDAKYASKGLVIIGVEAPEFPFEDDAGNVAAAVRQFGIRYPVVQDNNLDTWNEWGVDAWPTDFLIDSTGQVRYEAVGEGDYTTTESAIRILLAQAGAKKLGAGAQAQHVVTPSLEASPETYLGTARAAGWIGGEPTGGRHTYPPPGNSLGLSQFAYGGTWSIGPQQALADANASIEADIEAKHVYMVLTPPAGHPGTVSVAVDGRHTTTFQVTSQRLYPIASFAADSQHSIQVRFSPGTSGYTFTFG
jgi:thiol-disulfide isomerase/thioredoxin